MCTVEGRVSSWGLTLTLKALLCTEVVSSDAAARAGAKETDRERDRQTDTERG